MAGGPTCNFRGKEVPCFIDCSPKASITSQMLADMLATIDGLGVYEREEGGPTPFLLLDGHHSRLELPFLRYITDKDHEWMVCIGVPYGTHLWQVADSSQQNGRFKIAITKIKQEIMRIRTRKNFVMTDVVPIVSRAFAQSFAEVEGNQHAIALRGWFPLNYNLLLHPDILKTKGEGEKAGVCFVFEPTDDAEQQTETTVATSSVAHARPEELNLKTPSVMSALETILEKQELRKELDANVRKKRERDHEQESNHQALKKATRVTSGSLVATGTHLLNDTVSLVLAKHEADAAEQERLALRRVALNRKHNRVTYEAYQKYKRGEALNGGDLKKLLQHTQEAARKDKPASHAANVPELRSWWEERRNRESAIAKLESLSCNPVEEEEEEEPQFELNLGDESGGDDDDEGRLEEV